ncbi:hypothetical protein ACFFJI_09015 [Allobacillus sp. GCM10007491]|uniref:Lipoprotein n=1 Tax=Allobacillus saliphilus TaxID=2912308 RepID=A0A941CTS8_9BACI|nr:hypothetical protein [Allobacillus saliphilus]MBR7553079.1 hypothetical protein [Allobacillus saliphilus]
MKHIRFILIICFLLFVSACQSSDDQESQEKSAEDTEVLSDSTEESEEVEQEVVNTSETKEEDSEIVELADPLVDYPSEKVEYARVWLQHGELKDVDSLNVRHIPAGTPLNPNDETSASYPEDVIQLSGARLVAGSVTYSGNGDGTINIYNVPLRWDGQYPAGEEFYQEIIDNTEEIYVEVGDNQEIMELIEVMNVQ